jgi:hypothetical protein
LPYPLQADPAEDFMRIRIMCALFATVVAATAMSVPSAALGAVRPMSHGGGGGGGGGTPPPPSAPAVTITPGTLTFPAEPTGATSPPQTFTISNTGSGSLFINSVSDNGPAATDFTRTDDQCVGTSVPAGASCTITVVFHPTADGTRTDTVAIVDNAPNSPQLVTLSGVGGGTGGGPTPLAIYTNGLSCADGVCDLTGGSGVIVNNFEATMFTATGGTAPYRWSAANVPTGLTFAPSSLLSGSLPTVGTFVFSVTVRDAASATATQQFSITVRPKPAPGPSGCQRGPGVRAALSGPTIGGKTPSGQASEDESNLTACGGFGVFTVSVKDVNLPNGSVLWVYLDSGPVGTITLSGGAGTMRPFILEIGLRFDPVEVINGPPPVALSTPRVLSGSAFH